MPLSILLAASPSFINEDTLQARIALLKQRRPDAELHVITQKHFTKMVTKYKATVHARDFAMNGPGATTIAYNEVLEHADGAIIFWDGESKSEQELIRKCKERPLKHDVIVFESLKQELERLKREGKVEKRKKITVPLKPEEKQRYFDAHKKWYERQYPTGVENGFYTNPKMFPINSGGAMDNFIVNFLVWDGWSATKISVLQKRGKEFIRTGAKPGTFDLTATIKGKSVKIETKHCSDTASDDQLKMQIRERNAGAIAEFVYSIGEFFILYDKIVNGNI